jgi:hypothetical protein
MDSEGRRKGRFLILSSVFPRRMKGVPQWFTDTMAVCELGPLWMEEIDVSHADDLWLMGGFPDGCILDAEAFPGWQHRYLDLVLRLFGKLWAFGIMLSSAPDRKDLARLTKTAEMIGADRWVLISWTTEPMEAPQGISTNLAGVIWLIVKAP